MNRRRPYCAFAWIGFAFICAAIGSALYRSGTTNASAPALPDALNNLPSDSQFVFGVNVQKVVSSPLYLKAKQKQNVPLGKELSEFIAKTGIDPERDVHYLAGAGRSATNAKGEGVLIVTGSFNSRAVAETLRSQSAPRELTCGKSRILMMPEGQEKVGGRGIVFLSEREIAAGDLEALKKVIDIRENGKKGILASPAMSSLIQSINPDDMVWFAGDAAAAIANAPVKTPLGQASMGSQASSIRSIVGAFNLTDALSGKITAVTADAASAAKMADVARGFISLGQLSGDKNPDLRLLLSGLTISQDSDRVSINLDFPATLLKQIVETRASRIVRAIGN